MSVQGPLVLERGQRFPEGPLFDLDGRLWWSEIDAGSVTCRLAAGGVRRHPVGGRPNGMAIDAEGRIHFCDGARGEVARFDPATGARETVADGHAAPNDLVFDAVGNLIFTCPGDSRVEPTGYVACVTPGGVCTVLAGGLRFPNGLAFAGDGSVLVVAETYHGRLLHGRWDAVLRKWIEPRALCATTAGPNGPDGMAVGADGLIYVAIYGAGCLDVIDSPGVRARSIAMPGLNPTNCAFDPSGRLGLVVTEAASGSILSLPALGTGRALFTRPVVEGPAC